MKIEKIDARIAAMYLGQKCDVEWPTGAKEWTNINSRAIRWVEDDEAKITPHLRRLDSMTEEEARELYLTFHKREFPDNYPKTAVGFFVSRFGDNDEFPPVLFLYLLSKGFDLLGLIEAGLAKDVSTIG